MTMKIKFYLAAAVFILASVLYSYFWSSYKTGTADRHYA